eukprot:6422223-Prymnesium_polylepis.1
MAPLTEADTALPFVADIVKNIGNSATRSRSDATSTTLRLPHHLADWVLKHTIVYHMISHA